MAESKHTNQNPMHGWAESNRIEPAPDWLFVAIAAINRLPENNRIDKARNEYARQLVRSIEADCICAPDVRQLAGGRVTITFKYGSRLLEISIPRPGMFFVNRMAPYEKHPEKHYRGWPGDVLRGEIRWVFPTSNNTYFKGMVQVTREGS